MDLQSIQPGKENVCGWKCWIRVTFSLYIQQKIYTKDKILKLFTLPGGQELHIFMGFTANCSKIHSLVCSAMKFMLDF